MKKLFTLSLMVVFAFFAHAQSTHTIDFEPAGLGADWSWTVDQNGTNPALGFIANPVSGGINTTATVAKFTAMDAGADWALFYTNDDGEFTFDATNSTVKIMVYKTVLSDVGFKVEGSTNKEIKVANTVINQWEELTFDFSSEIGKKFGRIVIIPDFAPRTTDNIIYVDNIQVPDGVVSTLAVPAIGAPVPTHLQANVKSIYSDTYAAPGNPNYNPGWGQSTVMEGVSIDGNPTIKYTGLTYQGNTFDAINASAMDYLHVDFWTPDGTVLRVSPINTSVGKEAAYNFGTIQTETWVSVDIPISYFTGVNSELNFSAIDQLKFDSEGTPGVFSLGTYYIDNIYFWDDVSTAVSDITEKGLKLYPNPASDILHVEGVEEGAVVEVYGAAGNLLKKVQISGGTINVADLPAGVYFVSVNGATSKIIKK